MVGLAGGRLGLDPPPIVGLETGVGLGGALVTNPLPSGVSSWSLLFAKMATSSVLTFVEGSGVLLTLGLCGLAGWTGGGTVTVLE